MNKIKGDKYEIQIRDYIINDLNKQAYLWKDTPETILIDNGIIGSHNENRLRRKENINNPLQDTGIDIIQMEWNGCALVQCKSGYKSGVTMKDLAGFMCWMSTLEQLNGSVYYTDKLSLNVRCLPQTKRIQFYKRKYIERTCEVSSKFIIDNAKLVYQNKASEMAVAYFKNHNRGILSMPCGTGKTYVSYMISLNYEQIVIICPLKQFAKQNLDKFVEYGYNNKTLLVDSDGERDVREIKKFIENNKQFLISTTYDSVDVIWKSIKYMNKPFFVIDEFHNLSKANVFDEEDYFNKLLASNNKILFMSATPRVYELEDDNDDTQMEIFGETIYNMSFTEAIDNKYITDYRIWLPSIHEKNTKLKKELSIYKIDTTIKSKCMFLLSCLVNNGSRKCIIYCVDTSELELMMDAVEQLNEYFYLDLHISNITSKCSENIREKRLKRFADSNKIEIMFSIRILDECIDIPSCDSIYITHSTKSKIRTIQRLCRCIRVDKNNKFKIGNVYIWCEEYDEILETLSGIKEYDVNFKDKIKLNCIDEYNRKTNKSIEEDYKLIRRYVVGIKEYRIESWEHRLDKVKKYIDNYHKKPVQHHSNIEIKMMGQWLSQQQNNYKRKIELMRNQEICDNWAIFIQTYSKYFKQTDKLWEETLGKCMDYINKNKKRPSMHNHNTEIRKMGQWLSQQQNKYKRKIEIMKNPKIYNSFSEFLSEYSEYFKTNIQIWNEMLDECNKYINENKRKPTKENTNYELKKMGQWLSHQQTKYKKKIEIMKNPKIYNKWSEFIEEHSEYFK